MVWSSEFPEEVNRDNLLLFLNEPRQMNEYSMVYRGIRKETREEGFVDQNELDLTIDPLKVIKQGSNDTLTLINPEKQLFRGRVSY